MLLVVESTVHGVTCMQRFDYGRTTIFACCILNVVACATYLVPIGDVESLSLLKLYYISVFFCVLVYLKNLSPKEERGSGSGWRQ